MFGEGIANQVVLVILVQAYCTVSAYELLTRLTVDFELLGLVSRAVEHLLLGRVQAGGLRLDLCLTAPT